MRQRILPMVCAVLVLVVFSGHVVAQESPIEGLQDATTVVAEWIAGVPNTAHVYSAYACPNEHPWYRAVVDGLAAIEPTSDQAWRIAYGWQPIIECDDPTVADWYSRALTYATSRRTAQAIAEALLSSNDPEHLDAVRDAVLRPDTPESVMKGLLLSVHEGGELSLRTELFLLVFEQDRIPGGYYFAEEVSQLLRSDRREEFVMAAAEAVREHPGAGRAAALFAYLAYSAAEPPGSPFAVSQNVRRGVLGVLEELKAAPEGTAGQAVVGSAISYEATIRQRIVGG